MAQYEINVFCNGVNYTQTTEDLTAEQYEKIKEHLSKVADGAFKHFQLNGEDGIVYLFPRDLILKSVLSISSL